MSANEKLQKAIEATIAAGYQLNSEAFEFLIRNSSTTDPVDIMNSALQKLHDLQEKPFFIDKVFLETLAAHLIAPIAEMQPYQKQNEKEPAISQQMSQINAVENIFYPYARDIKSSLNILEDSSGKLSSNGTLEESGMF